MDGGGGVSPKIDKNRFYKISMIVNVQCNLGGLIDNGSCPSIVESSIIFHFFFLDAELKFFSADAFCSPFFPSTSLRPNCIFKAICYNIY